MLAAVALPHPDACGGSSPAHEEKASVARDRRLGFILATAQDTHWRAGRAAVGESDLPDVEGAAAVRGEEQRFAIGGPRRFTVPLRARRDARPLPRARDHPQVAAYGQRKPAVVGV